MILFSLPATTMVSVYQRRLGAGSPYTMQEITAYTVELSNSDISATILFAKRGSGKCCTQVVYTNQELLQVGGDNLWKGA